MLQETAIWKYTLLSGLNELSIPGLVKVLSVAEQYQQVRLWCIVTPNAPSQIHKFAAVMTGQTVPEGFDYYIGTALMQEGDFVLHVFAYSRASQIGTLVFQNQEALHGAR